MSNLDKKKRKSKAKKETQEPYLSPPKVLLAPIVPPAPHFDSPIRTPAPKEFQPRSTAIAKSPYSKMVSQLQPLPQPIILTTPRQVLAQEMIHLRTPNNHQTLVEMKMIEKLDFDSLGYSGRKPLDIINGGCQEDEVDEYQYSYYEDQSGSQVEVDQVHQVDVLPKVEEVRQVKPVIEAFINKLPTYIYDEQIFTKKKVLKSIKKEETKLCCNCKKSRCLKLYCECFRNNQLCSGCNCVQCLNVNQHCPQRFNAYANLVGSNPHAFTPKIESQKHTRGCNCRKSNCQKRYCECYQAGLTCTDLCRCEECKNTSHTEHKRHHKEKVGIKQGVK